MSRQHKQSCVRVRARAWVMYQAGQSQTSPSFRIIDTRSYVFGYFLTHYPQVHSRATETLKWVVTCVRASVLPTPPPCFTILLHPGNTPFSLLTLKIFLFEMSKSTKSPWSCSLVGAVHGVWNTTAASRFCDSVGCVSRAR